MCILTARKLSLGQGIFSAVSVIILSAGGGGGEGRRRGGGRGL